MNNKETDKEMTIDAAISWKTGKHRRPSGT